MPDPTRTTFDAVLAPADYPVGKVQHAKLLALKEEFGPVLGSRLVHTRSVGGNMVLLTGGTEGVSLYHGDAHPLTGQERYDWLDRGTDGVKYGLLTDAAKAADAPAPPAAVKAAQVSGKVHEYQARKAALAAKPDRTDDEQRELDKLGRFLAVMAPGVTPAPTPSPVPKPVAPAVPTPKAE